MIGTKLQLSPVCLECWQPTDQVRTGYFSELPPFKGRWLRKMRGVGNEIVVQPRSGIVAIEGNFRFERAVSL